MAPCCRDNSPEQTTPAADGQCCSSQTATRAPADLDDCCSAPEAADRLSDASDAAT